MGLIGCFITGRTTFDLVNGWDGRHPLDVPVVVLTHEPPTEWIRQHPDAPFIFVTEGVPAALEKASEVAGNKAVEIGTARVLQACLDANLVDEIHIDLIPILLGDGVRFFAQNASKIHKLEQLKAINTPAVNHLMYRVVK